MSVLSGYGKYKRYILTSTGYKLCSQWTSSNTILFDDGNTAQTKVGAINGITDSLTSTSSNIAASAASVKALNDKVTQVNSDLSGKMDKSSSNELIICRNFSWTEEFKTISIDRGTIPSTGYLHLIFQVGNERYGVLFDTIRGIIQPFFLGQNETYNFYINVRIDSDTQLSLCVKSIKGYRLDGGFANKPIWLRTYYVS